MLYLIDSSSLIAAKNHHYQFDRVRPFWDWLLQQAAAGYVKMPYEIIEELKRQEDDLKQWVTDNKEVLLYEDRTYLAMVGDVLDYYQSHGPLSADQIEGIGADPYLVACASLHNLLYGPVTVVTDEVHKPSIVGARRRMPNICDDAGIQWCDLMGIRTGRKSLIDLLDFRI